MDIYPKKAYRRPKKKKKKNPHEKMLNITDYYRNANQNSNEISTHINQNGYHQKIHRQ